MFLPSLSLSLCLSPSLSLSWGSLQCLSRLRVYYCALILLYGSHVHISTKEGPTTDRMERQGRYKRSFTITIIIMAASEEGRKSAMIMIMHLEISIWALSERPPPKKNKKNLLFFRMKWNADR